MDANKVQTAISLIKNVLNGINFAELSKYDNKHLSELKQFVESDINLQSLEKIKRKANLINKKILADSRLSEAISIINAIQDAYFGTVQTTPQEKIIINAESLSMSKDFLLKYISPEAFNIIQTEYENRNSQSIMIQKLTDTGISDNDAKKYVILANMLFSYEGHGNWNPEWYMYVGSNLTTTREFCKRLTKKKYIHKSEIPTILSGDIDGHKCTINKKTGLPAGLIEGTTPENFEILRGGWNCGHSLIPVSTEAIPESIRNNKK
jgi:hypothetical protein